MSILSLATKNFQIMHHLDVQLKFTPAEAFKSLTMDIKDKTSQSVKLEEDISFIAKLALYKKEALLIIWKHHSVFG